MKLRVLAFAMAILAFFLFVGAPFQQSVNAVAGIDDAIIAVIIAALAAMGITIATTASFNSLEEYVASLLNDYAASIGLTSQQLLRGSQVGTNKTGKILLNNRLVEIIDAFGSYLIARFSLVNNSSATVQTAGTYWHDYVVYQGTYEWSGRIGNPGSNQAEQRAYAFSSGAPFIVCNGSSNTTTFSAVFIWNQPFSIYSYWMYAGGVTEGTYEAVEYEDSGYYYAIANGYFSTNTPASNFPINYTKYRVQYTTILQDLIGHNPNYQPGITIDTGTITLPSDDPDYTEGDGAVIDLDLPWGLDYDEVDDEIPDTYTESEIEYQGEDEVVEQIEDTPVQTVSENADDYQVNGLVSVFPFCIPFDMYNFVECLVAEPVAPSFTWRFYVPGICDESIVIDLSDFDGAAQILRTMELLLFCVGLAFVTRKIIRG